MKVAAVPTGMRKTMSTPTLSKSCFKQCLSKDYDGWTHAIDESLEGDNKVRSHDCFNLQGFTWALSIVYSRSYFLDGTLRLLPILDYANHKEGCNELQGKGCTIKNIIE